MKNINSRVLLSAICVASILAGFTKTNAGPIRFDQVVTIVNAKPGKAETGMFSRIRIAGDYGSVFASDDDDKKKSDGQTRQDNRVITETRSEIVEDDTCDCVLADVHHRGFPKWALLGLAAIPIAFLLIRHRDKTPTPTATVPNMTPTPPGMTPTPTPPGMTPTPTPPGMTPTPTPPPMTPTPTPPQPVPEPVTILLFGTGLASVGLAARRRFGKKGENGDEKGEE